MPENSPAARHEKAYPAGIAPLKLGRIPASRARHCFQREFCLSGKSGEAVSVAYMQLPEAGKLDKSAIQKA
jgi:hypothetical protein